MAETYWKDNVHNRRAVFELYFRKLPFDNGFGIFAGLERIIDYIKNFHFSASDLDYLKTELGYDADFIEYLKTVRFNGDIDRKSTRLNSSHVAISYAVFCLKK